MRLLDYILNKIRGYEYYNIYSEVESFLIEELKDEFIVPDGEEPSTNLINNIILYGTRDNK